MSRRASFAVRFAAMLIATLATGCGGGSGGPDDASATVVISGRVFATGTFSNNTSVFGPPAVGAIVSTSLDSSSATTDSSGTFRLTTTTPASSLNQCSSYTVTITAVGHPTYSLAGAWGTSLSDAQFSLSPPSPVVVGCQCPNPPAACSSGGSGGGPNPGPERQTWSVQFNPGTNSGLDMSPCGLNTRFSSQVINVAAGGSFNDVWSPSEPDTVRVQGTLVTSGFTATMTCLKTSATGSITAAPSGSSYTGTATLGSGSAQVRIVRS